MKKILLVITACLLIAGCQIQLVSNYDQITDTSVTAEYTKLDSFCHNFNLPDYPGVSSDNQKFYSGVHSDIRTMLLRAQAIAHNSITVQQLQNLDSTVTQLQQLDELGLNGAELQFVEDQFEVQCESILKFELAKKRGQS